MVTASGKVALWSGGPVPGWPVSLGARARAGAAFADVDGDGKLEVVVGDEAGRLHALQRGGGEARGFPVKLGAAAVTSTPSSAVFAGGLSLAVGCDDGRVHVVSGAGVPRPGFPLVTAFTVSGAPAFADLDEDGLHDLVVGSQDFKVHAVDQRGRAAARLPGGRRLPDLRGGGGGRPRRRRPPRRGLRLGRRDAPRGGPGRQAAGRLPGAGRRAHLRRRRGGRPDALRPARRGGGAGRRLGGGGGARRQAAGRLPGPAPRGRRGRLAAPLRRRRRRLALDLRRHRGRAGPRPAGRSGPAPAAVRGPTRSSRSPSAAPVAQAAAPWPGPGHDAARTGRYGPNPPTYRALELQPAQPRTGDRLAAAWKATWLDAAPGEAPPAPRLEWQRDGKPVAGLEGQQVLPAGTARRGERWRFTAAPPAGGPSAASAEVRILDTAPGAPEVRLEPPAAVRGTPVTAVVARGVHRRRRRRRPLPDRVAARRPPDRRAGRHLPGRAAAPRRRCSARGWWPPTASSASPPGAGRPPGGQHGRRAPPRWRSSRPRRAGPRR